MPDTTHNADNDKHDNAQDSRPNGRVESALATARDAANGALDETRRAARRAGEAAEANPLAVVAGGIALGLAAGALLPKTKRETELLGPVGRRLTDAASDAATAARDAAKAELAALPLSKDAARAQVAKVLDQVGKAVTDAGDAAMASRKRPDGQANKAPSGENQPDASNGNRSE